jgi:L-threonylcarbamoyladenylate synthase
MSDITCACKLLEEGKLIGLPTETVYGLAADAFNTKAVVSIYTTKGRPQFNPLIVHGHSIDQFLELGVLSEKALILAKKFWPGPLTLVVPRLKNCPLDYLISAGMETLALRIPAHPVALNVLQEYKKPLTAPSANLSNSLSPTTRAMVLRDFPDLFVLDGGMCRVGLESTIISLVEEPTLLRPGGIPLETIEHSIKEKLIPYTDHKILAPGMMKKHYSPNHSLRLNALFKTDNEVLLGFGDVTCDLNLSHSHNLAEAASNLYRMLFELDQKVSHGIAVSPIPNEGLGIAINDRLTRAAQ